MDPRLFMIVLRVLHIVAGAFWVGTAITLARILLPAFAAVGPTAAPVMREIVQHRRLPARLIGAMVFTVVSGIGLVWHDQSVSDGAWARTPMGMTFSTGAAFAILAAIVGVAVSRPAANRLVALGESTAAGPPSPELMEEMRRMRTRMTGATHAVAVLLVLATACMAAARYV
jgi:uncharacterized membrane protein